VRTRENRRELQDFNFAVKNQRGGAGKIQGRRRRRRNKRTSQDVCAASGSGSNSGGAAGGHGGRAGLGGPERSVSSLCEWGL